VQADAVRAPKGIPLGSVDEVDCSLVPDFLRKPQHQSRADALSLFENTEYTNIHMRLPSWIKRLCETEYGETGYVFLVIDNAMFGAMRRGRTDGDASLT